MFYLFNSVQIFIPGNLFIFSFLLVIWVFSFCVFSAENQLALQWQYFIQLNIPKCSTFSHTHSKETVRQMWPLGSPEKGRKASLSQSDHHALTCGTLLANEHHCRFDIWCTGDNCKEMETRMEKPQISWFSKSRKGTMEHLEFSVLS